MSLSFLAVPSPDTSQLLAYTIVHLTALVVVGLLVASDLSRFLDDIWFAWLGAVGRRIASGAAAVALTVGVVALVTLPSSAALRLTPSLQFLQLLSALDIAWAAGATLIGARWLFKSRCRCRRRRWCRLCLVDLEVSDCGRIRPGWRLARRRLRPGSIRSPL